MGTTYQAQVDVFFRELWQPISRWELQKDYAFSIAWSKVCESGWPNDAFLIGDVHYLKYGYDVVTTPDLDLKQWGDGQLFASIEPTECFEWFFEAREHVKRLLEKHYRVRVLTWGE